MFAAAGASLILEEKRSARNSLRAATEYVDF